MQVLDSGKKKLNQNFKKNAKTRAKSAISKIQSLLSPKLFVIILFCQHMVLLYLQTRNDFSKKHFAAR